MNTLSLPLYLGKDPNAPYYFFFAYKEGMGRFIKYTKSPFWCGTEHVEDFLAFEEVPEKILKEVEAFAEVKITVTMVPKKRSKAGRKSDTFSNQEPALEQDGVAHVANSRTPGPSGDNPSSGTRGRSKAAKSVLSSETHSSDQTSIIAAKNGDRSCGSERNLTVAELSSDSGSGRSGRRSDGGPGNRIVTSVNDQSDVRSDGRRESSGIVLDSGRNDPGSVVESSASDQSFDSGSGIKPKRKRRTKAEMAAARAAGLE